MTSGNACTAFSKAASSLCSSQRDVHEAVAGEPGFLLVEQRDVTLDQPLGFERTDPPQAGGLGQVDEARQLDVADAAVPLQRAQDGAVEAVQ